VNTPHISPVILWSLGGLFGILISATAIYFFLKRTRPDADFAEIGLRIRSWWIMVSIFTLAMLLSRNFSLCFFAFISFLALKEYLSIIPTRRADRRVLLWAYLAIPVQYIWASIAWYGMFIIFIPVYVFLFLPLCMVNVGETRDFLRSAGTLHWGLMTMVFSISHMAYLLVLPPVTVSGTGGSGLLLYLVFLTQSNDVAQFLWGKSLGRRKIVPNISPNKTLEGFLGGVGTTTVLAVLLGGLLTPLSTPLALLAGILISMAGFVGDVTISAVKRDIGIKDSGSLLPGHGGILDRIDSLTYSAPLFFHFIHYFYY
jgi:phosphatidate cytidylyltransferase